MIKPRQMGVVFSIFVFFLLIPGSLRAQTDFYWEQPEIFSPAAWSFPVSAFNDDLSLVAWQETAAGPASGNGGVGDGLITVSLAVKPSGGEWRIYRSVGGPYTYSGTEPSILSAAIDRNNSILLAAAVSANETEILISDDRGESFSRVRVDSGSESSVAPRIYSRADGGYLIFITRGLEQSLSIYYARSDDGFTWSAFRPFVSDPSLQLNFLPAHSFFNRADYVIFQSFLGGADITPSFQLFLVSSTDGGQTWTSPRRVTTFQDPVMNPDASPTGLTISVPISRFRGGGSFWSGNAGLAPVLPGSTARPSGPTGPSRDLWNG